MSARSKTISALTLSLLACLALPLLSGAEPAGPGAPDQGKYIGASKCKNCHGSADSGDQNGAWSKAKHAHAFEVLASEEAKKTAAARGIADPQKDDACVQCHVTGFGEPEEAFGRGWKPEQGVQCETCHGPGETHMKDRFKAAAGGAAPEGWAALPEGEMIVAPAVDVCVKCHNPKSPNYEPFCYFEARAEIAHLNPQKPRSVEEKADYGKCPHGSPCPHGEGCPDGTCNLKPDELQELAK